MTNAELIKSLRYCPSHWCVSCPSCDANGRCLQHGVVGLMRNAADAIQTLCDELATYHAKSVTDDKRIAELEKDIIYWQTYAAEIER